MASVTNTTTTEGGAEIGSDADLAERVYLAPGAYSTAGPEDGYLYHSKAYNPAIGDVVATSDQEAGTVDIVFIMADGSTPGPEMISGLKGPYLNDRADPPHDGSWSMCRPRRRSIHHQRGPITSTGATAPRL
ncbi:MAG: baseplate J/gp47 family protein [Oscillospiraceae bacterium]